MDQNNEDYDDGPVLRWRWRPRAVGYRRRFLRLCWEGPVLVALFAAVQAIGWVDGLFVSSPLFRWRPGWGWWLVAAVGPASSATPGSATSAGRATA